MTALLKLGTGTLLFTAFLGLAGCGKNDANKAVADFMKQARTEIPTPKAPEPLSAEDFTTTFQTVETRDPFTSLETMSNSKKYPNSILQQYTLESLRLIGVLEHGAKKWAVITAPDEKIYRITVGTRIGKQQSLVTKITPNTVFLQTDQFPSNDKKESTLSLQKK